MYKRKLFSILILCLLIPTVVIAGFFLAKGKQYYIVSLLVIAISLLPFMLSLEKKKLQLRELVITSSVIAISVASRAAFFYLPNIKPMCAILIISAISFGAEFGFTCGALSMLLSNFIYGQGIWTPFQMLAMGVTVFVSALIFRTFKVKNRYILGISSGVLCFALYGIIVDLGSLFMFLSDFNIESILSIYLAGIPFNAVQGVTTAICVVLFQPILNEKLERIKQKYGLFSD
ncbi:MAG: ECF transporter S component [Ruminococcus sp.]|nr:ECF transporter S component [Candidatus Copronaster equi]